VRKWTCDLDRGARQLAVADDGDRADDLVRPPRQPRDVVAGLAGVGRLAEDVAVDGHQRVRAEDEPRRVVAAAGRVGLARHGERLAARVLPRDGDRLAVRLLVDARDADVERDPDLLEDRASLWRPTRQQQVG